MFPQVTLFSYAGNNQWPEDGHVIRYENDGSVLAIVYDGVSGFYTPDQGPRLFGGRTGAQSIGEVFTDCLTRRQSVTKNLEERLVLINSRIADWAERQGINKNDSHYLPSLDIAAAWINTEKVEIMQTSDCLAIWVSRDGLIEHTINQGYLHDKEMGEVRARLGGGSAAWSHPEHVELMRERRMERVNKRPRDGSGYAMLNGQPEVADVWFRLVLDRKPLKLILLLTDGLYTPVPPRNQNTMVRELVDLFSEDGLKAIAVTKGYENITEGTGIAIEFF